MKMLPRSESIYLAVLALVLSYAYDVPLNTHKLDFWDANQVRIYVVRRITVNLR